MPDRAGSAAFGHAGGGTRLQPSGRSAGRQVRWRRGQTQGRDPRQPGPALSTREEAPACHSLLRPFAGHLRARGQPGCGVRTCKRGLHAPLSSPQSRRWTREQGNPTLQACHFSALLCSQAVTHRGWDITGQSVTGAQAGAASSPAQTRPHPPGGEHTSLAAGGTPHTGALSSDAPVLQTPAR